MNSLDKHVWREHRIWQERPALRDQIDNAMAALARYVPARWVREQERACTPHPLAAALAPGSPFFDHALRVGEAIAELGVIPHRQARRLLLDPQLHVGAVFELEVGAVLQRAGIGFLWEPRGADFRLQNDALQFIEAKHARSLSERATDWLTWGFRLQLLVTSALPKYSLAYQLDWDLADRLAQRPDREAALQHPEHTAAPLIAAARDLIASGNVPGEARAKNIGVVEVAPTEQELRHPGFQGFPFDEQYEARRVVRSTVRVAGKHLSPHDHFLTVVRWDSPLDRITSLVQATLDRRPSSKPTLVGALLVSARRDLRELFPRYDLALVAGDEEETLLDSNALAALVHHFSAGEDVA